MKKFIFLLAIFMTFVNPAFSISNWVQISEKMYMDTNSLRKENRFGLNSGSYYSIWTKWLNDGSQIFIDAELQNKTKVWYFLYQGYIDCYNKQYAVKSYVSYDLNNDLLGSFTATDYQLSFSSIPPGSVAENLYNYVCQYSNSR